MTEVEVKIRLPSVEAHDRVLSLLGPAKFSYLQRNVFFDGLNGELGSKRAVLRLRFYDLSGEPYCLITVKEDNKLVDGISRSGETEEHIDFGEGLTIVANPALIMTTSNNLLTLIRQKYNCTSFKCLGEFNNMRHVINWEDHKIELDETRFAFGKTWEIEVESTIPEVIKAKLEAFLTQNTIPYSYSKKTKFANFITNSID
ncbi:triphosphate tunnel metalloenzyme 3 [Pelomyxa schiedti]|nr:triphosphate tunnel metalloenzyme 3 [Pelomyxa schiedti]